MPTWCSRALALRVDQIERHPFAAQCFFPLDVAARYAVMGVPSDAEGDPCPRSGAGVSLMPGNDGRDLRPGVCIWGATALDRAGHFGCLDVAAVGPAAGRRVSYNRAIDADRLQPELPGAVAPRPEGE